MKYLYTGFKGSKNSSYQLVDQLSGEKYFLTNSFQGVERDIQAIETDYQSIIMFGLDNTLCEKVRIEKAASKNEDMIYTKADTARLTRIFDKFQIDYLISDSPTHYLCNDAYYHCMKRMDCEVVFIHIPSSKNISDKLFENLVQAFEKYHA